jgi:hypothetical protein
MDVFFKAVSGRQTQVDEANLQHLLIRHFEAQILDYIYSGLAVVAWCLLTFIQFVASRYY